MLEVEFSVKCGLFVFKISYRYALSFLGFQLKHTVGKLYDFPFPYLILNFPLLSKSFL